MESYLRSTAAKAAHSYSAGIRLASDEELLGGVEQWAKYWAEVTPRPAAHVMWTKLKAREVYQTVLLLLLEQCLRDGYSGTTSV